jgi:hypothetical protein
VRAAPGGGGRRWATVGGGRWAVGGGRRRAAAGGGGRRRAAAGGGRRRWAVGGGRWAVGGGRRAVGGGGRRWAAVGGGGPGTVWLAQCPAVAPTAVEPRWNIAHSRAVRRKGGHFSTLPGGKSPSCPPAAWASGHFSTGYGGKMTSGPRSGSRLVTFPPEKLAPGVLQPQGKAQVAETLTQSADLPRARSICGTRWTSRQDLTISESPFAQRVATRAGCRLSAPVS